MNTSKAYLNAYLNRENPPYKKTIEGLTFQISFNSLSKAETTDYAIYAQALDPIFFNLSQEELGRIELLLPPYSEIVEYVYKKKGIDEEDLMLLTNKISRLPFLGILSHFREDWRRIEEASKRVRSKIIKEEFEEILAERSKKLAMSLRKLAIPLYTTTGAILYIKTLNPFLVGVWLSSILPYYSLTYASYLTKNRKISNYLRKATTFYAIAQNPLGFSQSMMEFGIGAPLAGSLVEKAWPYLPKNIRKMIDVSEKFLSGIKLKPFDEREIRAELYEASKSLKTSLPGYVVEKFREKIEDSLSIKVENPREILI
jgi:hypothetical protein